MPHSAEITQRCDPLGSIYAFDELEKEEPKQGRSSERKKNCRLKSRSKPEKILSQDLS